MSRLHIHRRRPVGPVRGPFMVNRQGALGTRTYACRCGATWERDEYVRQEKWRRVEDEPR